MALAGFLIQSFSARRAAGDVGSEILPQAFFYERIKKTALFLLGSVRIRGSFFFF